MGVGKVIGWVMTGLCFATSVGYFIAKDYHRGFYFFFAGCINTTVIL